MLLPAEKRYYATFKRVLVHNYTHRNRPCASHWVENNITRLKSGQPEVGSQEVKSSLQTKDLHLARQAAVFGLKVQSPYSVMVRLPRLEWFSVREQ